MKLLVICMFVCLKTKVLVFRYTQIKKMLMLVNSVLFFRR